jgi:hypothetical protein
MMFKTDIAIIITNLKDLVQAFDSNTREDWTALLDELISCVKHDDHYAASIAINVMEQLLSCSAFDAWPHGPAFAMTAKSGLLLTRNFVTSSAMKETLNDR